METDKRYKILIVDDEHMIQRVGTRLLEKIYDITTASSGQEALETYETTRPDLVLLDMVMPNMGGRETFDRLRSIDETANVLIQSGFCDPKDIEYMIANGARGFIKKPYDPNTLRVEVGKALDIMLAYDHPVQQRF